MFKSGRIQSSRSRILGGAGERVLEGSAVFQSDLDWRDTSGVVTGVKMKFNSFNFFDS